ncbi:MAG: septum formation initiator family protein [Proteobacteria bacterium]|nr:septum formation initiator family protein [Pseudomonadota bacterium]
MKTNFLYNFVKKNQIGKHTFICYFTALVIIFYFLISTIFGEKGLIKFFVLKNKIETREITKQELSNKMRAKKNLVEGMSSESLDLDLVDEQSRKVLGYVGKNEVVIYPNQNDNKQ